MVPPNGRVDTPEIHAVLREDVAHRLGSPELHAHFVELCLDQWRTRLGGRRHAEVKEDLFPSCRVLNKKRPRCQRGELVEALNGGLEQVLDRETTHAGSCVYHGDLGHGAGGRGE